MLNAAQASDSGASTMSWKVSVAVNVPRTHWPGPVSPVLPRNVTAPSMVSVRSRMSGQPVELNQSCAR